MIETSFQDFLQLLSALKFLYSNSEKQHEAKRDRLLELSFDSAKVFSFVDLN